MFDSVTLWTVAHQPPPSIGIFRQEDWSVAISTSRGLSDPGIEPASSESPALQAYSLPPEPLGNTYSHLILTEKLWNCLMNTVKSQF